MKRIVIGLAAASVLFSACSSSKNTSTETTVVAETAAAETLAAVETTVAAETSVAVETSAAVETTLAVEASVAALPEGSSFNAIDVRFSQGGLGHHAQAVEIAEIALDPKAKARPEIVEIGKAITSPSPEFDSVEGLLTKWGQVLELSKEEMAKMDGMATPITIDNLATLSGTEFDTAYLTTMIRHHEGAIKMAERAIAEGTDPELKPIATKILGMRQSELVLFKKLLG